MKGWALVPYQIILKNTEQELKARLSKLVAIPPKNQMNDVAALKAMIYVFPSRENFLFSETKQLKVFSPGPNPHHIGFGRGNVVSIRNTRSTAPEAKEERLMFRRHLKHKFIILHLQVFALAVSDTDRSR